MGKNIYQAIERVKLYKDILDIKFIETEIGKYRLRAERFKTEDKEDWISKLIHKEANFIEKQLKLAIEEYDKKRNKVEISE